MRNGQIPADFPEFDAAKMSETQYAETCRRWMLDHPELVTEEYHTKLTRKYGQ